MKKIIDALKANPQVSDYKINLSAKESYECFYVKGKLETVRCTEVCDKTVTVYVDHGEFKGDSQFFVYPSTTEEELQDLIEKAVQKASLLDNKMYALPENETGDYAVESNFSDYTLSELAGRIADAVFDANQVENADLNSVEVFVNRRTDTVTNSRGITAKASRVITVSNQSVSFWRIVIPASVICAGVLLLCIVFWMHRLHLRQKETELPSDTC